jgi:hypothetical protein
MADSRVEKPNRRRQSHFPFHLHAIRIDFTWVKSRTAESSKELWPTILRKVLQSWCHSCHSRKLNFDSGEFSHRVHYVQLNEYLPFLLSNVDFFTVLINTHSCTTHILVFMHIREQFILKFRSMSQTCSSLSFKCKALITLTVWRKFHLQRLKCWSTLWK